MKKITEYLDKNKSDDVEEDVVNRLFHMYRTDPTWSMILIDFKTGKRAYEMTDDELREALRDFVRRLKNVKNN